MRKWNTTQQMANEIAILEVSPEMKELNISQCNRIASLVKKLYTIGGKYYVLDNLYTNLESYPQSSQGLNMMQKNRVMEIVEDFLFWDFIPFSRIRCNMNRLGANG